MDDNASLLAFIQAIGGQALTKKKAPIAPGGISHARPAPSRINSQDGISDSAFVDQIISAAQQMAGGTTPLMTTGMGQPQPQMQSQGQPPMQPQGQPQQGGQGAGIAQMLQALGGGR